MSSNQQQNSEYSAENIKVLSPREHVRMRPGMYIGGTDKRALHNMLWFVMDEAIDESQFSKLSEISITLIDSTRIRVSDNGAGIPIETDKSGKSVLEAYMTDHGLSRRNYIKNRSHDLSGRLHAIHLIMMNALASECIAETKYNGYLWRQTYREGQPTSKVEQIRPMNDGEETGTSITFTPDFTIMEDNELDFATVTQRCQELAYLFPYVTFRVDDKRESGRKEVYHYPNGIEEWIQDKTSQERKITDLFSVQITHPCEDKQGDIYEIGVHLAFQYVDADVSIERSFVNSVHVPNGGTHLVGLKKALCACLQQENEAMPKWKDVKRGFVGMMHILHPDPPFESQTRVKVLNPDIEEALIEAVKTALKHPNDVAQIREHIKSRKP